MALPAGCNWLQGAGRRCSPACYQTDGQSGKHSSVTCLTRNSNKHPEWTRPVETHTIAHKPGLWFHWVLRGVDELDLPSVAGKIRRCITQPLWGVHSGRRNSIVDCYDCGRLTGGSEVVAEEKVVTCVVNCKWKELQQNEFHDFDNKSTLAGTLQTQKNDVFFQQTDLNLWIKVFSVTAIFGKHIQWSARLRCVIDFWIPSLPSLSCTVQSWRMIVLTQTDHFVEEPFNDDNSNGANQVSPPWIMGAICNALATGAF